jgi:RNA polymerase sigma factor (sigma-70 family)
MATLVHHIRRLAGPPVEGVPTDRQLLERFSRHQDESAFAVVVQRHGPLVFGVCRRMLHCQHDAEDAFQATFLVLAKKAGTIHWQESVGGWLYDVASRVARKAKAGQSRGLVDERQRNMMALSDAHSLATRRELQEVLDEELRRLPEKYRLPLVLCCLEGVSRSQAAGQLGWQEGTVAGRLARARELLQRRLARRGVVLSAATLTAILTEQLGTAAVPASLAADTVAAATCWIMGTATTGLISQQALALANATLFSIGAARWKIAAAVLLTVGVATTGLAMFFAELPAHDSPIPSLSRVQPEEQAERDVSLAVLAAEEKEPAVETDPKRVEAAIAIGLKWLIRHQALDGHWGLHDFHVHGRCNCTEPAKGANDIGGTSLALLALLGAGHTHKATEHRGIYAKNVERGLKWLITRQAVDGSLGSDVHAHGLATLTLCSVYGMTGDPIIKGPAQRALNFLVAAQEDKAGRLRATSKHTLWLVLAGAKQGQMAGLQVPKAKEAAPVRQNVFREFSTGLALECLAKEHRTLRGAKLANLILDNQDKGTDADHRDHKGSWSAPDDALDGMGGRLTATALMLLALEGGAPGWEAQRQVIAAAKELPQKELAAAWEDLRSPEFLGAHVAMLTLIDAPKQTVPFLNERLQPVPPPDPRRLKRIERLIAELDAPDFATRQKASDELATLGMEPEGELRKVLAGKPSLEVRQRVEALLDKLMDRVNSPEMKAIAVLYCIGTPEAKQLLHKLAKGYPAARLTREGQAALDRLAHPGVVPPRPAPPMPEPAAIVPLDPLHRIGIQFSRQQRFGISCSRLRDPRNPEKPKPLTHDERGLTNNTCLSIDGRLALFGSDAGRLVEDDGKLFRALQDVLIPGRDPKRSAISVWDSANGKIRVVQSVEIVVGEQTRLHDTALVKYRIENRDDKPHEVGLRFLLDTCIGANTGVPFYVPQTNNKQARLVDTMEVIPAADMPDYTMALETADLNDPNATLASVSLKIKGFEPLDKAVICRWPDDSDAGWGGSNAAGDWRYEPINQNPNYKDSCLLLYWATRPMKPGEQRDVAFAYGLGRVSQEPAGK